MRHRLTKITTKQGDNGRTRIANGDIKLKSDIRICAIGDIDELNAALGLVKALLKSYPYDDCHEKDLIFIQNRLFDIGGELALPENTVLEMDSVIFLEAQIDAINSKLPALKEFVIPGENYISAQTHLARCIARRAERQLVALNQECSELNLISLQFINRLSDYLFVLSRVFARQNNSVELQWNNTKET
ncbi:MAG: cob(I)yrinic acid a,c-diamide adenosyltransferase [Kangiellaceae bacterium]|nr:cob(I)yrinic acid a,c-diamide adenosyltransferase [Kangiellaceae bacterium]